jgi:hypothetical protein
LPSSWCWSSTDGWLTPALMAAPHQAQLSVVTHVVVLGVVQPEPSCLPAPARTMTGSTKAGQGARKVMGLLHGLQLRTKGV